MNTNRGSLIIVSVWALLLSTLNSELSTCLAQGNLTPPGAPTPTMKSLDQLEARTPISSLPYAINNPGSYYLTGNLSVSSGDAITINTGGVTLDLNGFTISSTASSANGTAILMASGLNEIAIRNGIVQSGVGQAGGGSFSGSGFVNGISFNGILPGNVRVSDVTVLGVLAEGINLSAGNATVVERCTVQVAGDVGIYAQVVSNSAANYCGNKGIFAGEVSNSAGHATISGGYGVEAYYAIHNCEGFATGTSSPGAGLFAPTVDNSYGHCDTTSGGYGISAGSITNSYGYAAGGIGVYASGAISNCYGVTGSTSSGSAGVYGYAIFNSFGQAGDGYGIGGAQALNCYGFNNSATYFAINAVSASQCYAFNTGSGEVIDAYTVSDCEAFSLFNGTATSNTILINGHSVTNSSAEADTAVGATGIKSDTVQNSWATVTGNGSVAIKAARSALNSYGVVTAGNGTGINGPEVSTCYGSSVDGVGIIGTSIISSFGTAGVNGSGLSVRTTGATMSHCSVSMPSGGIGIDAGNGSVVEASTVSGATTGIKVTNNCLIAGNSLDNNANGIVVSGTGNRLDGNRVDCPAPGSAFVLNGANNIIVHNSARDNSHNQYILNASPNSYGSILNVSSGGQLNTSDPWANFVY